MTYATVDDMTTLWRPMTEAEQARRRPSAGGHLSQP